MRWVWEREKERKKTRCLWCFVGRRFFGVSPSGGDWRGTKPTQCKQTPTKQLPVRRAWWPPLSISIFLCDDGLWPAVIGPRRWVVGTLHYRRGTWSLNCQQVLVAVCFYSKWLGGFSRDPKSYVFLNIPVNRISIQSEFISSFLNIGQKNVFSNDNYVLRFTTICFALRYIWYVCIKKYIY